MSTLCRKATRFRTISRQIAAVALGLLLAAQTYYRWRKEFGGLKLDQAKRLKELERENTKLKRLVTELPLDKQILKDVAEGNF